MKERKTGELKQQLLSDIDKAMEIYPYPKGSRPLLESHMDQLIPLWQAWNKALDSAKTALNLESDGKNVPQSLEELTKERFIRKEGKIIIGIVGAAGSGKDTVAKKAGLPQRALQTTTRNPRQGERDGVDYEFLTESKFDKEGLYFKTEPKPGRGSYGFRKPNIDKSFSNGTAVVIQSARDSVTMCERYTKDHPEVGSVVIYIIPGEPIFAHLALRYAKRIIEEGGIFEEGIEGTLGMRNILEFQDVISLQKQGKNIAFLVNDSLDRAATQLNNLTNSG